eukprot:m.169710 g.169710  ORF g.169710 m.169710 type:complete len:60 (-) comp15327_c0_seq35:4453-4632(-)
MAVCFIWYRIRGNALTQFPEVQIGIIPFTSTPTTTPTTTTTGTTTGTSTPSTTGDDLLV